MYRATEMARLYSEAELIRLGGSTLMAAGAAYRLAYGLVQVDRATGKYKRVCYGPAEERLVLDGLKQRDALGDAPGWASSRP